jgi:outer membrane protein TolC
MGGNTMMQRRFVTALLRNTDQSGDQAPEAAEFPHRRTGARGTDAAAELQRPVMTQELFDGGRRHAQSEIARAGYDATVDLAALRILHDEGQQQREAVDAAKNALRLFTNRYVGGEDTYLQVITVQTAALANQRNDVDILRRRMEASIRWSRRSVADGTFPACQNSRSGFPARCDRTSWTMIRCRVSAASPRMAL